MSTVLIVDDDPVSRQFMKDVLSARMKFFPREGVCFGAARPRK